MTKIARNEQIGGNQIISLENIKRTVGGNEVKELVIKSNCGHCSLSKISITGLVLVGGTWHRSSWNYNLENMSGIDSFRLIEDKIVSD